MKITKRDKPYAEVVSLPRMKHKKPMRPMRLLHGVIRLISIPDLLMARVKINKIGMERLGTKEPCLILMNHSCFLDLEIASACLFPRPFHIVCTSDGFVGFGMELLMRLIGCIPTTKFVTDLNLVRDLQYALKQKRRSVLMYPEASYSFDGTATPLPESIGGLVKMLGVPVVMIRTYGAFSRKPLYNNLRTRKVPVTVDMKYLISPEDIKEQSAEALLARINAEFDFDHFRWQLENGITVDAPKRAEGLSRVLYKCPHCLSERMQSGDTTVSCPACGKVYTLLPNGQMEAEDGNTEFPHIPDWYAWERQCVRAALEAGDYHPDIPVEIRMLVNTSAIYRVGVGRLRHSTEGFHLVGCEDENGVPQLDYKQKPLASYSLYADYYWYEIGDMICIGDTKQLYYCFPQCEGDVVAKTRLATEELYRMVRKKKQG